MVVVPCVAVTVAPGSGNPPKVTTPRKGEAAAIALPAGAAQLVVRTQPEAQDSVAWGAATAVWATAQHASSNMHAKPSPRTRPVRRGAASPIVVCTPS